MNPFDKDTEIERDYSKRECDDKCNAHLNDVNHFWTAPNGWVYRRVAERCTKCGGLKPGTEDRLMRNWNWAHGRHK